MKNPTVNFIEEFHKLQKNATKHITKLVKKHKVIVLYTEPANEDEEDMIYDAPRLTYINKHNEYTGYGIIALTLEANGIVGIKAKNVEEDSNYETFTLADMMTEEIIFLADIADGVVKNG